MNVNIYGFSYDKSDKPENLLISEIFDHISDAQGAFDAGKLFKIAVVKLPQNGNQANPAQYGGMILRFRDAKSFNKYSENGGKITVSTEKFDDNDKMVEFSFFVVNKESGSGLITHYQNAPSIINLGYITKRSLKQVSNEHFKRIEDDKSLSTAEKKAKKKKYRGSLEIQQLCRTENLKKLVKDLKKVNACEIQLKSVKTKDTFFKGFATQSDRQSIKFHMSDGAIVDEIAEEVEELAQDSDIKELKIYGKDAKKRTRIYKKTENALYFESYDYDNMMGNIELDLSQWNQSVATSPIIKTLQRLSLNNTTRVLLK